MRITKYCFICVFVYSGIAVAAADLSSGGEKINILYHEPVTDLQWNDVTGGPAISESQARDAAPVVNPTTVVSFDALGRHFELALELNKSLIAKLGRKHRERINSTVTLYRGSLLGTDGSWARLTKIGNRLSGMIWDGQEILMLDPAGSLSGSVVERAKSNGATTVIYRLSDVDMGNAMCGTEGDADTLSEYQALGAELRELAQALPLATSELDLAIIADPLFVQANSTNPDSAVLARMNIVDGIYSDQVGVHLHITEILKLTSNGVLMSTDPSTLLGQMQTFATSTPGFTNPGLTHLFTGRDLNGGVIGIAFLGVLCNRGFGVGLSQVTSTASTSAVLVAHELGHNFGAPHDNQSGSACASTPGTFIMNSFLISTDQFSQCSKDQMQPVLQRAQCLRPISSTPTADMRITLPVNPITAGIDVPFSYRIELQNGGTGAAEGVTAAISVPAPLNLRAINTSAEQCSANAGGQVNCVFGTVAGSQDRIVTLTLESAQAGTIISNVSVAASNDSNTGNNNASQSIRISSGTNTGLEAHFDTGVDGFAYVDDAFRGTLQPSYASGAFTSTGGFTGGGLRVTLGGRDNAHINNMSGGWTRTFNLAATSNVVLSLRYRLSQSAHYESDEISQSLLAVDGRLIGLNGRSYLAQIRGNGNGGASIVTGWTQLNFIGTLAHGAHTIAIGGFNNKKSNLEESSEIIIDDVVVTLR